jgi:hypothetical protein
VAVFAMSAVAASASAATNNPQWVVEGKTLAGTAETQTVTVKADGNQKLSFKSLTGNITIACHTLRLGSGAKLIGSSAPSPGTSEMTVEYGECGVEGKPKCEINGNAKITLGPLVGTLVYSTKAGAEAESAKEAGLLLKAKAPLTSLGSLTFKGSECPWQATSAITGEILTKTVGGDPTESRPVHELEALEEGKYFSNEAGAAKGHEVKRVSAFGQEAGFTGQMVVQVGADLNWNLTS